MLVLNAAFNGKMVNLQTPAFIRGLLAVGRRQSTASSATTQPSRLLRHNRMTSNHCLTSQAEIRPVSLSTARLRQ